MIEIPKDDVDKLALRLRRIAGQINGIEKMLLEGRECESVINQIAAAAKALDQVGFKLVAAGLRNCMTSQSGEDAAADIARLEKYFSRLS
ncbi:MAG: metal-sensitive transcriptional regulator [Actinomycetota bacterium]|nr:metal-sensitive transcriptional regulator [Actinomycetota bacterium]